MTRFENLFRHDFITALAAAAAAAQLTEDQLDVLGLMADSLQLSNVVLMSWRDINAGLGRPRADKRIVRTLAELRQLGWIAGRKWGCDVLAIPATAKVGAAA